MLHRDYSMWFYEALSMTICISQLLSYVRTIKTMHLVLVQESDRLIRRGKLSLWLSNNRKFYITGAVGSIIGNVVKKYREKVEICY